MANTRQRATTVHSWDEVPAFGSEAEESAFWATHELSDELLAQMTTEGDAKLPPPRPRTRPIAIRFDESTILRVKALAHRRGKGYQTLLKEFVAERLYEEEKREGVVGG
ncbi:MAG: CopG family antitoxin [Gammaproteobacteria bacterium]